MCKLIIPIAAESGRLTCVLTGQWWGLLQASTHELAEHLIQQPYDQIRIGNIILSTIRCHKTAGGTVTSKIK